jgi:uncharacterized membrane protein YphA (DoxX/SURF4 family)
MQYQDHALGHQTVVIQGKIARTSLILLRISIGIVFLWFGLLKLFPEFSPAEELATRTIETLTLGLVQPGLSLPVLAVWEIAIGLGLLTNRFLRPTLLLLVVQMMGTFTPLVLFPHETWLQFPIAPTLEGQYILKNIVLVSGGLVILALSPRQRNL